jgi:hypothetical protein
VFSSAGKDCSINGDEAETEIAGVRRRVSIAFTPEAKVGDYVLLHTGYAIGNRVVRGATGALVEDSPSGFRAMSREFALGLYLTNPFSYTIVSAKLVTALFPLSTHRKLRAKYFSC